MSPTRPLVFAFTLVLALSAAQDASALRSMTVGSLIPWAGWAVGDTISSGIPLAVEDINANGLLKNFANGAEDIELDWIMGRSQCNNLNALSEYMRIYQEKTPDVLIGPACSGASEVTSLLSNLWDVPQISYASSALSLNDKIAYPRFARTVGPLTKLALPFTGTIRTYGWTTVSIITSSLSLYQNTGEEMKKLLEEAGITVSTFQVFQVNQSPVRALENVLDTGVRVVILLCAGGDMRTSVLAADDLDMVGTGWAWLTSGELFRDSTFQPAPPADLTEAADIAAYEAESVRALHATHGFISFSAYVDEDNDAFRTFIARSRVGMQTYFNHTIPDEKDTFSRVAVVYDSVLLWAHTLRYMIEEEVPYEEGRFAVALRENMMNVPFDGVSGNIQIDFIGNIDRDWTGFNRLYMDGASSVRNIGLFSVSTSTMVVGPDDSAVIWPGASAPGPPPIDGSCPGSCSGNGVCDSTTGVCACRDGFSGAACATADDSAWGTWGFAVLIVGVVVLLAGGILCFIRSRTAVGAGSDAYWWRISFLDLKFERGEDFSSQSHISIQSATSSLASELNKRAANRYLKACRYHGQLVGIEVMTAETVTVDTSMLQEFSALRDCQHDNIVRFHGVCADPSHLCAVFDFCSRGTLEDVLALDEIKLDWIFMFTMLVNISKGMNHLRKQPGIRVHGALRTNTVFIDKRWTLKVGGFGLRNFRAAARPLQDEEMKADSALRLHTDRYFQAPEQLTSGCPSLEADVYALGMVCFCTVIRDLPFCDDPLEPAQVLDGVMKGRRPNIPEELSSAEARPLMLLIARCWSEEPGHRPTMSEVERELKSLNPGKSDDLTDNMMMMMESYTENLEKVVAQRTKSLVLEQKKTEDLLCRMLPRAVADKLKVGDEVPPEAFDLVSVFFSDIVGFTAISARSTPFEIVNLLNDLYSVFDTIINGYSAYKVETIGDAYMVVSGLPDRNGHLHSREIALLALDILSNTTEFVVPHDPSTRLRIRIGLHCGPVVAGVVGLKMPRYCLFGDTVNTASRMESTGVALRIHCSGPFKRHLDQHGIFLCDSRGEIAIKGKGQMETWWLYGASVFDKPLPEHTPLIGQVDAD